jgi:hypothetical protein
MHGSILELDQRKPAAQLLALQHNSDLAVSQLFL